MDSRGVKNGRKQIRDDLSFAVPQIQAKTLELANQRQTIETLQTSLSDAEEQIKALDTQLKSISDKKRDDSQKAAYKIFGSALTKG